MPSFRSAVFRIGSWMLYFVIAIVFLIGAAVGSFINVCAYRLPFEKSVLWPGSRCGSCYKPVRWYDNLPLLSYWLLRGRCRDCGATFSSRYFWIELLTAVLFVGLFYLEVICNVLDLPLIKAAKQDIADGLIPLRVYFVFFYHAVLVGFLLAASVCDLEHMEIPLSLTLTGTVVGLVGSMVFAWPFPSEPGVQEGVLIFGVKIMPPTAGLYPWPVWHERPTWLPQGSWQLGLATGLTGATVGILILRGIGFLFALVRGIEGMGIGDADLMMMAGAFVGWQVTLFAFFVSLAPGLIFAVVWMVVRRSQTLPFGPALAMGTMLTLLCWPAIGGRYGMILQDASFLGWMSAFGIVMLIILGFLLRLIRGRPPQEE